MRKLKINLSVGELRALDHVLDGLKLEQATTALEKCAFAVLKHWHISRLKPKTYFITQPVHKVTLDAPVAFAFVAFFSRFVLEPGKFLDNSVQRIMDAIHQKFHV